MDKDTDYVRTLRLTELKKVIPHLPAAGRILEIGGGAGWQAKKLNELGFTADSIDIEKGLYDDVRVWPVTVYDGKTIPFSDRTFDVVFSSNVLEHIPHVREFQKEIKRVLKNNGFALHIVPSGSWRFWSNLTYYVNLARFALHKLTQTTIPASPAPPTSHEEPAVPKKSKLRYLIPNRHGEKGNAFSEIYYFSRFAWKKLFMAEGWTISKHATIHLFYTGYTLFGSHLPVWARVGLSRLLGSSGHIFILKAS